MSLGRQLAAGLEAAIRDGHLRPGARLPATRDLARRLGVHRSTVSAAYARLRRRGCASGGSGGRFEVATAGGRPASSEDSPMRGVTDPDALAAAFVRAALHRALGDALPRRRVIAALARAVSGLGGTGAAESMPPYSRGAACVPLLVEPRPGLRLALAAELERRLAVPVAAARGLPAGGWPGPVLARPEVLARFGTSRFGRARAAPRREGSPGAAGAGARLPLELIPLPLAGGTRERGIVRRSVRGGVVVLVSASRTVREFALELAARDFERGVSFVAVDPADAAELVRALGIARLVLHDEASRAALPRHAEPTVAVRLVRSDALGALRAYLGIPAPPTAPASGPRRRGAPARPGRPPGRPEARGSTGPSRRRGT